MKILLTGAGGFMGSHVARELVHGGHEVHAVIRSSTDQSRIEDLKARMRIWTGEMDHVPIEPELAIHLAWVTTPGTYVTTEENRVCLAASIRLLHKLPCRAVFVGTCFELQHSREPLGEWAPTSWETEYSACKNMLRQMVVERPRSAWARVFYLYGPWENPARKVPTVIRALLRGDAVDLPSGEERRDYLHVEDVASAICAVALSSIEGPVNIGSGEAPTVAHLMQSIGRIVGRPELVRLDALAQASQIPVILADNARLRSLGWSPRYNLLAGLTNTVDWWGSRAK